MSENVIDGENIGKMATEMAKPKARTLAKKANAAKKVGRAKKSPSKPKAHGTNKKAEVIAMMKRTKRGRQADLRGAYRSRGKGRPLLSIPGHHRR